MTVTQHLAHRLADTYSLALKTQTYHWNVEGPQFFQLHEAFEAQYDALAEAVDDLAERIRALGQRAPGGFAAYARLRTLADGNPDVDAETMVADLAADHQALAKAFGDAIGEIQVCGDEVTADLFIERVQAHEKTAWMLNSVLGRGTLKAQVSEAA